MTVVLCALSQTTLAAEAERTPYPRDVRVAFQKNCAASSREMIKPCRCMIDQFEATMSLAEFAKMSKAEDLAEDSRFTTVANNCAQQHAPQPQQ